MELKKICRGSYIFGTACGACERCFEEASHLLKFSNRANLSLDDKYSIYYLKDDNQESTKSPFILMLDALIIDPSLTDEEKIKYLRGIAEQLNIRCKGLENGKRYAESILYEGRIHGQW